MSEDKQKQRKAVTPIITLAVICGIKISESLLKLIEQWLEDESGELVGHEDFPFTWFGGLLRALCTTYEERIQCSRQVSNHRRDPFFPIDIKCLTGAHLSSVGVFAYL